MASDTKPKVEVWIALSDSGHWLSIFTDRPVKKIGDAGYWTVSDDELYGYGVLWQGESRRYGVLDRLTKLGVDIEPGECKRFRLCEVEDGD